MDFNNYGDAPSITPGATSYFSAPSSELDPKLFQADHLNEWVRSGILTMLFEHLVKQYADPHTWTHAWLANLSSSSDSNTSTRLQNQNRIRFHRDDSKCPSRAGYCRRTL